MANNTKTNLDPSSGPPLIRTIQFLFLMAVFIFTGTNSFAQPFNSSEFCWVVADQEDQLHNFNLSTSNNSTVGGSLGVPNVEAIALGPDGQTLYAANANQLGTVNTTTGVFTPTSSPFGSADGALGVLPISDVDGLSFDPVTNTLYGANRRFGVNDLLVQIDPVTGAIVQDAFGAGIDYVEISGQNILFDVDDLAYDHTTGKLFAINDEFSGSVKSVLIEIDPSNGNATFIDSLDLFDVEGISMTNNGLIIGVTGYQAGTPSVYEISKIDASTTFLGIFNSGVDFESVACRTMNIPTIDPDAFCYAVSDATDELYDYTLNDGSNALIGAMTAQLVEAIELSANGIILYGSNASTLGTIDKSTGAFTPSPNPYGTANGALGAILINDVDGLAMDPNTNTLYGSHRINGGADDLLVKINTTTGAIIPNAFGPGNDYVVISGTGILNDVDDLAFDEVNNILYGINDENSGQNTQLITINTTTGNSSIIGPVPIIDIEGLSITNDGLIIAVNGGTSGLVPGNVYILDSDNGYPTYIGTFGGGGDFEAIACRTSDVPVAVDDSNTTNEDTPVTGDVSPNDSDPLNGPLIYTINTGPTNGNVTLNPDGTYTYTPDPNFNGTDTFTYTVTNSEGNTDTATVVITVLPVNDPPVANDDSNSTPEDTPVSGTVTPNDSDPESDPLTYTLTGNPTNGNVTLNPNGTYTYTPNPGFNGTDTFTYIVSDGNGGTDTATVVITVTPVNDDPTANDDSNSTPEDTPVSGTAAPNDSDPDNDPLTFTVITQPDNGTVTMNPDGTYTYTPDPNFNGVDTFEYEISDGNGGTDTAIITITVTPVNDAPIAEDDSNTTPEDTPVSGTAAPNDSDPENDPLSFTLISQPDNGTVTMNPDGSYTYTPDPDFNGVDTFEYQISDGNGGTDTAIITITVTGENDPPVAVDDTNSTPEDTQVTGTAAPNDSDPDNDPLTFQPLSQPDNGSIIMGSTGNYIYSPNPGFNGVDTFLYQISDGNGGTDTAVVTITVIGVNDDPIAEDDSNTTPEDTPVSGTTAPNDSDPDNDPLTFTLVTGPPNGSVVLNPDGTYTYTPDPDFSGVDTFEYQISDGNGGTDNAIVTITVTPENDDPIAVDDNNTTPEDTPVSGTLAPNDSDPDNDPLQFMQLTNPDNGTITVWPDGTYTYLPDPNFNGTDTFLYQISDGNGGTDTAVATIVVTPVNDPPVAVDDNETTELDTPITASTAPNDSDPENDDLTATLITPPANGNVVLNPDGTYTYTPDTGYSGTDTFLYEINDGEGGTDQAVVTIVITPCTAIAEINGPATTCAGESTLFQATNSGMNATYSWDFGTDATPATSTDVAPTIEWSSAGPKTITLIVSDGQCTKTATLNITVTTGVFGNPGYSNTICEGGSVQLGGNPTGPNGASYFWSPSTGLNDPNVENPIASPSDTTEYTLYVTLNGCVSTSTVTVNVDVNSVPFAFAGDDTFVCGGQEVTLGGTAANPTGPEGATYTWSPANGLDDAFAQNPVASPVTSTTYTVTIEKNGCFKTDDILVEVLPSPPVDAGEDQEYCIDSPQSVVLGGPGNNPFAAYQWTPTTGLSNATGANTFAAPTETTIYQLCATRFGCTTCDEVVVVVNDCNEPPLALNDDNNTLVDTPVDGSILTNDSDPNDDPLQATTTLVSQPTNGSVTLNPDGTYTYTPNPGYTGTDNWDYEICETGIANPKCDEATVTIEIRENTLGNNPPVANDDTYITEMNTPISSEIITNDGDPDSDEITIVVTPTSDPTDGTVTINPDGTMTYTPDPGFVGEDKYSYEICDSASPALCDEAEVTIIINPEPYTNRQPVANDDRKTTPKNESFIESMIDNDNDPDGDAISVATTPISQPSNGSVIINPDGTYDYTPNNGFVGVDTFEYQISDTEGNTDEAVVTITIFDLNNEPPVALDEEETTSPNQSVDIDILANDNDPDQDNISVATTPISQPANGTVFINPDGTARYVPNLGFVGVDSFEYEICDNISGCDQAVVTITIIDDNPAMNEPPVATDDNYITPVSTPVDGAVIFNDFEPEGEPIMFNPVLVSNPTNGSVTPNMDGTFTYTPNPGYIGDDTFDYEICDPNNLCDQATVTITIVDEAATNNAPIAEDDFNSTPESTPVSGSILGNDSDPDGDPITLNVTPLSGPDNGNVILNEDGTYTYVPSLGFTGTDTFDYEICDDEGNCDPAVVTIDVYPAPPSEIVTNIPPRADDDAEFTFVDVPFDARLDLNDLDPEGTNVIYATAPKTLPVHGTVSINADGTYTYTPDPGYSGPDQFVYEMCDTGSPVECVEATAYITIYPFNTPPVAINDDNLTPVNVPVNGNVMTNDFEPDGDNIIATTTLLSNPTNGTVTFSADGAYTYTPNADYVGEDQFEYEICDDGTPGPLCTTAIAVIQIVEAPLEGVNNPPIAVDDDNLTYVNIPISGTVLPNDFDPEGNSLAVNPTVVSDVSFGNVNLNFDGTYTYTPDFDYEGLDQFDYQVCDNGIPVECETATVYLTVLPTPQDGTSNLPPFAEDDFNVTDVDVPVSANALLNDADPDSDPLIVTPSILVDPENGTASIAADGTYTYTPNAGYVGPDNFVYEICDGISGCSKATVYILIEGTLCVDIQLAVWLEGAYNTDTGLMDTKLNLKDGSLLHRGLLPGQTPLNIGLGVPATPAGQPYNKAPWNYTGTEGIGWTNVEYDVIEAEYGADVVDWVLVSFRTDIFATNNILQAAALVLEDGRVVFVEECILGPEAGSQLYIVVEHRNHMGVMTPNAITIDDSILLWDFRTSDSYVATAGFGSKQLAPGVWSMYAGDGDQEADFPSYDINGSDKILWTSQNGNFDQYLPSDYNMNGDVNGADKILWSINNGIASRVPKN